MTSFEAMVAEAKAAADRRASLVPLARLKEASRLVPGAISALSSLRTDDRAVTVIAEVKRSTATFADLSELISSSHAPCANEDAGYLPGNRFNGFQCRVCPKRHLNSTKACIQQSSGEVNRFRGIIDCDDRYELRIGKEECGIHHQTS